MSFGGGFGPVGPGQAGPPGVNGADGADGIDGADGAAGAAGAAATIALGTVGTGDPGTSVIVTNTGTSAAAEFNFIIPRGDVGAAGAAGADGAPGAAGSDGYEYHFGCNASGTSGVVQWIGTGPSSDAPSTVSDRSFNVRRARNVTEIALAQTVGAGTSVMRHELYVNGTASGKYLDVPVINNMGAVTLSPALALAVGDRLSMKVHHVSGVPSSAATNVRVTAVCEDA